MIGWSVVEVWLFQVVGALIWGLFRGESGPTLAWRLVVAPALATAIWAMLSGKVGR